MPEACPVCDTLWRLYSRGTDNLRDLVAKHGDSREKGDRNSVEILSHEINIAEATLRSVRRELRHHERAHHNSHGNARSDSREHRPEQPK